MAEAVAEISQLDGDALRRRWRALVGKPLPPDLGRPLIVRVLVYKIQALRLGDLDKASSCELARIASTCRAAVPKTKDAVGGHSLEWSGENGSKLQAPGGKPQKPVARLFARPGTLLMREHEGVAHRVMVMEGGVSWNGRTYESLSEVAFAITGTKWNGPRFFGLRDPPAKHRDLQEARKPRTGDRLRPSGPGGSTGRQSSP